MFCLSRRPAHRYAGKHAPVKKSYGAEEKEQPRKTPGARPDGGTMDETELQSLVTGILADSVEYVDGELTPSRALATDYYLGKPLGNEEEGRSQFVMTEVRDGITAVLPSLLRMFFSGPDRTVEFVPSGPNDVAAAKQRTDYVQYVFAEDNKGFLVLHSALKDALIRKTGVIKWGWDDTSSTEAHEVDGISYEQMVALVQSGAEPTRAEQNDDGTYKFSFTTKDEDGRPWVKCIPPEELLIARATRDEQDALLIGHRTDKTKGDLIAMGIDEEEIDEALERGKTALRDSQEEVSRRGVVADDAGDENPNGGAANDTVLYVEGYFHLDFDGDGTAELRKICTVGEAYTVVINEPADDVPFAIGCPDPEPHTLVGGSWADRLMDLQKVNSSVVRASLDSLSLSIYPRTAYVEGQVSVEDILNTDIGAPIRTRVIGAVTPFAHPFTGEKAFPFFELFKSIKEGRTGQNGGPSGLDADALQSSTPGAVEAAVTAAQEQKELLARIFAETMIKPMFRGIYRLLVKHKPKKRMVKLSGSFVEVDPSTWSGDCNVTVNIALGTVAKAQRVAVLEAAAAKMETIITTMGVDNPICSLPEYADVLATAMELNGFKAPLFKRLPPDWKPPAPQPPQPSDAQILAQAELEQEKIKTMKELTIKERELELKEQTADREHERALLDLSQKMELAKLEMELKYKTQLDSERMRLEVERGHKELDNDLEHRRADTDDAVAAHTAVIEETNAAHDRQMAEHAAETARQQAASETTE